MSSHQLKQPGLLAELDACVDRGLDASRVIVEITESALSLGVTTTQATLSALRERGVEIAVDDFGTGYSSLARLSSAPVTRLKIDRSFVSGIDRLDAEVPIVDATITMAAGLGLDVVAEGVETRKQLAYLRAAGCQQAQGFLLAEPAPADAVDRLVRGHRPWEGLFAARAG